MTRRRFDRVVWTLAASLVLLIGLEALFARRYSPVFPWHYLPGYAAAIGLVGCIVVVVATKALGKWRLQRPEEADDE